MARIRTSFDISELASQKSTALKLDFLVTIGNMIEEHNIESPIEQMFLVEWNYQMITEPFVPLNIFPQSEMKIQGKKYRVDFYVKGAIFAQLGLKFPEYIIELDGHAWHEKTPEQVENDKIRERALISSGYNILRFSGREIIKDVSKCVTEARTYGTKLTFDLLKRKNK